MIISRILLHKCFRDDEDYIKFYLGKFFQFRSYEELINIWINVKIL